MDTKNNGKKEKKGLVGFLTIVIAISLIISALHSLTAVVSFVSTQMAVQQLQIPLETETAITVPGFRPGSPTSDTADDSLSIENPISYSTSPSADSPLSEALLDISEAVDNFSTMRIVAGIASILFLIASLALLYLFFKKSRKFPNFYIGFLIIGAVFQVVVSVISSVVILNTVKLPSSTLASVGSTVSLTLLLSYIFFALILAAWIISIKKSKRIRLTFVN